MSTWYLRDAGVSIEQACSITGVTNPAAYMIMRAEGSFGSASQTVAQKALLLEVAAARSLMEAERSGVMREQAKPFIKQVAEAAYVYLATMQLSRRYWQSGNVPRSSVGELAQRVTSDEGQLDLHERLGVKGRYNLDRPFALFLDDGLMFSSLPPEPDQSGTVRRFVDIRAIARQIENYAGKQLFIACW